MKIGITAEILLNEYYTGIENYTFELIKEISKREKSVEIILPEKIKGLNLNLPIFYYKPFLNERSKFLSSIVNLHKPLNKYDIIHIPTVTAPFFFKLGNVKVVMTIHDLIPVIFPKFQTLKRRMYFNYILKQRLKNVDKFIAVSDNTKNDLIKYYKVNESKIKVIKLGVSRKFKPNSLVKEKSDYILCVSTLEPRKNFRNVINSFIYLKEKFNIKEKLIIVGKEGWYFNNLVKIPEKYQNCIDFKGFVEEKTLIDLYQKAKVFVYPSFYEGFGLPIIEAMACSCPVITSNVSSLKEVAGNAALLIDPNDIDDIAKAIYSVISDENLQEILSMKGLLRSNDYTWDKCAKETLDVYKNLL